MRRISRHGAGQDGHCPDRRVPSALRQLRGEPRPDYRAAARGAGYLGCRAGQVGAPRRPETGARARHAQGAHCRAEPEGRSVRHQPRERGMAGQALRRAKAALRHAGDRRVVVLQEQPGQAVSGAHKSAAPVFPRGGADRNARAQRTGGPLAPDLSVGPGRAAGQDDAQLSGPVLRHPQQLDALQARAQARRGRSHLPAHRRYLRIHAGDGSPQDAGAGGQCGGDPVVRKRGKAVPPDGAGHALALCGRGRPRPQRRVAGRKAAPAC